MKVPLCQSACIKTISASKASAIHTLTLVSGEDGATYSVVAASWYRLAMRRAHRQARDAYKEISVGLSEDDVSTISRMTWLGSNAMTCPVEEEPQRTDAKTLHSNQKADLPSSTP